MSFMLLHNNCFFKLNFITTLFTLYKFFHCIWVLRHNPLDLQPQINHTHDKQIVSRCMVCKTLWIIVSAKSNYLKQLSNQVAHLKIIFCFFHNYNGSKLGIHGLRAQYNATKCHRFPQHTYCTFVDLIDHGQCPHNSTYLTILRLVKSWNHVEGQASIWAHVNNNNKNKTQYFQQVVFMGSAVFFLAFFWLMKCNGTKLISKSTIPSSLKLQQAIGG